MIRRMIIYQRKTLQDETVKSKSGISGTLPGYVMPPHLVRTLDFYRAEEILVEK